jgi:peptidoglycan/xylan/chitin deacetylase (PgdA/CDA1 family)
MRTMQTGWNGRVAAAVVVAPRSGRHGAAAAAVGAPAVPAVRPALSFRLRLAALVAVLAMLGAAAVPARAWGPPGHTEAEPTGRPLASVVSHGPRNRTEVALTFDDGYGPKVCGALVDILVQTQTPATFFPNSVNVVHAPALWRRIAALGFPIGNHSATHPYMPRLTYVGQWSQMWSDRMALEDVIGRRSLSVFRPPYGAYSPGTLIAARATGYPVILNWDTSFADSSRRPNGRPWPTSSYVRAATKGKNGSVILGHCGSPIDVAALPAVIAWYRAHGFTFVTVPELLNLPGAAPMHFTPPPPPAVLPVERPGSAIPV